jgi:hypothetical protein
MSKLIEVTHPGTPPKNDPDVIRAMAVWDALKGTEQREVFLALCRSTVAYEDTGDTTHMTRLADSITGMVHLESSTNLRETLRSNL